MQRFHSRIALSALLALAVTTVAFAQTPSPPAAPAASPSPSAAPAGPSDPCDGDTLLLSVTDRPVITTGPCVVKTHKTHLEVGYSNTTTTGSATGNLFALPQELLRIGIATNLELVIQPPTYNHSRSGGPGVTPTTASGNSDSGLGLKKEFGFGTRWMTGAHLNMTTPSGASAFTNGLSTFSGGFDAAYVLTPTIGLGVTLGYGSFAGTNGSGSLQRYSAFMPSIIGTLTLPQNSQFFAEVANQSTVAIGSGGRYFFDTGVQHLIAKDLLGDIEYGTSLTSIAGAKSHYLGFGIARRL